MNCKSARVVSGTIITDSEGVTLFRVYGSGGSFKDYDLFHSDLEVTISKGCDAAFYEEEDGLLRLDHSPATLGLDIKEEK